MQTMVQYSRVVELNQNSAQRMSQTLIFLFHQHPIKFRDSGFCRRCYSRRYSMPLPGQCSIITFQFGVGMKILWQYFDARWKNKVNIIHSSLHVFMFSCFYHFIKSSFIIEIREEFQRHPWQPDSIVWRTIRYTYFDNDLWSKSSIRLNNFNFRILVFDFVRRPLKTFFIYYIINALHTASATTYRNPS